MPHALQRLVSALPGRRMVLMQGIKTLASENVSVITSLLTDTLQ